MMARSFREAEEASNTQGTVQAALDWALANAKKNPTPENIAIAKDTFAARQQTLANQPSSEDIAKSVNTAVSGLPQTYQDINKTIGEINNNIGDVNTAGQEAGVISQSMGGPSWNYVNDTLKTDSSMQDAYQKLYDEFNALGLGALVSDAKDLLMKATSVSAMPDALRNTQAYKQRFSANDARIAKGLTALSPAQYLAKEDAYQNLMRNYGLPASYYTPGQYGKQEGFDKLLANDVSAVELEDRIATAQQRVLNSNPEVLQALKQFYPDINNADILAYTLDPQNGLDNIHRKVTAAEIGGAALAQGLQANGGTAESLAGYGITKAQAQQGYQNVAQMVPRGSQLADIYGQTPYTQGTAEAEVFNTAGAADAANKRKKLTALEQASFSGSSGVGSLNRDRPVSNYMLGQPGAGSY
jgi:hypothetical protein